jgi:hypothetical protein
MNYINRHCKIQQRTLSAGGEVLYKNSEGSLDDFLDTGLKSLSISYPKFYKMDRPSKLGFLGAEVLLRDTILLERYAPQEVAVVMASAHSSLDTDLRYFESMKTIASPALFVYTLANIVAGEICIRHGIKGENAFFVLPAFDASQLYAYVEMVMASQKTKACLAGWADVMGEQHDVFLYLVEKTNTAGLDHSVEHLQKLYQMNYGKVDSRP